MFRKLWSNEFFQGGVFLTTTNFMGGFLGYLFNSLSAKVLGPQGYSEIVTLFAYLTVLSVPLAVITTEVVRRLGKYGSKKYEAIYGWQVWLWSKIKKWSFLVLFALPIFFFLPQVLNISLMASLALMINLLISPPNSFYMAAYQGLRWFALFSLIGIIPTLLKLSGPVLVIFGAGGINTIFLMIIVSGIFGLILGKLIFEKEIKKFRIKQSKIKFERRISNILLDRNIIIAVLSLMSLHLLNNLDVIFVKKFFSAQAAGIYGAWSLFGKIIFYVLGSFVSLSLIFFSSSEHSKYHGKSLLGITIFLVVGGISAYFGYIYLGKFLVSLIFTEEYFNILTYLPRAAVFGFAFTAIFIFNNFFLAKYSKFALIVFFFIPFYALSLFFFGKNINAVININIAFASSISLVYLIAIFYNRKLKWKRKMIAS